MDSAVRATIFAVYERYTQPARRVVYFASWEARLAETAYIESVHLLKALMYDEDSRANTLFQLRERFPAFTSCPSRFATREDVPQRETILANESKRIVVLTAEEADRLGHSWIDTEHFVLGLLKEGGSVAAEYLARSGLTLNEARRVVKENRPLQTGDDPPPLALPEPPARSLLGNLIHKFHKWRLRRYQRESE